MMGAENSEHELPPGPPRVMKMDRLTVHVRHLYVSRGQTSAGHRSKPESDHQIEEVACLYCISGHGLIGDRYFDHEQGYKGQITFFSQDIFKRLCRAVRVQVDPSVLRRNVIIDGVDLNQLIGRRFFIRGVQFEGTDECPPGLWMDSIVAPGDMESLKGNGGLRARILTDGWLRPGAADLFVHEPGYPG